MRCTRPNRASGFTIVEMLVVAPIILLTVATFVGVIIYLTGQTLVARTSNSLAYSVQDALNTIETDVTLSSAFLATNSVTVASPQGYDNNTAPFRNSSTTDGTMLILNAVATTEAPGRGSRQVIPLSNLPHACSDPLVSQNQVMTYNIIYFVRDNTLWRRTVMPSNYQTRGCSTPWQQPSCAPDHVSGLCTTEDMKLLEGITAANFTVQYFTSVQATTPSAAASNPTTSTPDRQTALSATDSAAVVLTATRQVAGQEVTYSGTVRANRAGPLSEVVTPIP